jgi:hypothetical protein
MRKRTLALLSGVAFLLGIVVPAANAASYATSYKKIFGHDTSCALGAGSVNTSTHKAGSRTVNRVGCNVNNDARAVPANYMEAGGYLVRPTLGYICSATLGRKNSSSASAVEITMALTVNSACPSNGSYAGHSDNGRRSDAGDWYYIHLDTGTHDFN